MKSLTEPQPLAENLWMLAYPLKMLGADLRRNVTLIRLRSGKVVIHSTAAFTPEDVAAIRALGEPGWLLDGILRHDTFAKEGREAFPGIPYLDRSGHDRRCRKSDHFRESLRSEIRNPRKCLAPLLCKSVVP